MGYRGGHPLNVEERVAALQGCQHELSSAGSNIQRLRRTAMAKFAAFDLSFNDSALCVLDADGNVVEETKVPSEADAVAQALPAQTTPTAER
jgi:hypothetical protein